MAVLTRQAKQNGRFFALSGTLLTVASLGRKQVEKLPMPRWRWFLQQIVRKIWFRAAAISLFSVLLALAAAGLAPL